MEYNIEDIAKAFNVELRCRAKTIIILLARVTRQLLKDVVQTQHYSRMLCKCKYAASSTTVLWKHLMTNYSTPSITSKAFRNSTRNPKPQHVEALMTHYRNCIIIRQREEQLQYLHSFEQNSVFNKLPQMLPQLHAILPQRLQHWKFRRNHPLLRRSTRRQRRRSRAVHGLNPSFQSSLFNLTNPRPPQW